MVKHSLLSPSSSHRWLRCGKSARLEEQFENVTSVFAEEGTAAHELSEHKLRLFLGSETKRPISAFDSDDLEYYTDIYVEYAKELITEARAKCKDPVILLEQRLDYSCYVAEGFGTGDLVIIADGTLDVVDLKYGKGVAVSAEDNPQMKLYALGALHIFDDLYDIQIVKMTIVQPRLDSISAYELSAAELLNWAENELRPKAQLAWDGEGEFVPGEHCKFCRARYTCRARAEEFLNLAKYDFAKPDLLEDDEIAEIIKLSDRLSTWASDVFTFATDKAIREGKSWDGFKLVEGRSNRKYTGENAVISSLTAAGYSDIYKKSLIGITDMEKLLGKKKFKELLSNLIEKPAGKATLVPLSDKRQSITINNTSEADFKEEI